MVFLLRASEAPHRTLRETDEAGVERTFWLWRNGPWVVCSRWPSGDVAASCAAGLEIELVDGGTVMVVEVANRGPLTD